MMNIQALLSHPTVRAHIERALAARGMHGDTILAHINPHEAAQLHAMGGVGTSNPKTGLPQFYGDDVGGPGTSDVGGPGNIGGGAGARADAAARAGSDNGGHTGGSGADHNGQGGFITAPGSVPVVQQPVPQSPAPVTLPAAPPANIPTSPMMSDTATANLIGSRFGAMPSWATTPYQVATAPTSYPVSGQPFGAPQQSPVPTPQVPVGGGAPGGGGGAAGGGGAGGGGQPGGGNGAGAISLPGILGGTGGSLSPRVGSAAQALLDKIHSMGLGLQGVTHQTPGYAAMPQDWTTQGQPTQPALGTRFANVAGGSQVTSSGASPAHPLQPTRAGGVLTGIMGSKPPQTKTAPPQAKTKIATASGAPRNR
jgi:hypothetical protein